MAMSVLQKGKEETNPSKEQFSLHLFGENTIVVQTRHIKQRKNAQNVWFYVGFAGEIGYMIALPLVGGALLGKYIDTRLSTYPNVTLSLLFVGLILSVLGFVRTIQDLLRRKN